jgi:DNA-binding response OmpR family regulator
MADRTFSLLIVSSDRTLLRRLTRFLEVFGYEVRQAVHAAGAEAAVEAGRVDFLVVDGALGKQTAQICRAVRRGTAEGYTYALLLTKDAEANDLTEALDGGFDDFLSAPLVFGELLSRLRAGVRVLEFERRLMEQRECDPTTGLSTSSALLAQLRDRLTVFGQDAYPTPPLYPKAPAARARCRQLELYADEIFFQPMSRLLYRTESAHRDPQVR